MDLAGRFAVSKQEKRAGLQQLRYLGIDIPLARLRDMEYRIERERGVKPFIGFERKQIGMKKPCPGKL